MSDLEKEIIQLFESKLPRFFIEEGWHWRAQEGKRNLEKLTAHLLSKQGKLLKTDRKGTVWIPEFDNRLVVKHRNFGSQPRRVLLASLNRNSCFHSGDGGLLKTECLNQLFLESRGFNVPAIFAYGERSIGPFIVEQALIMENVIDSLPIGDVWRSSSDKTLRKELIDSYFELNFQLHRQSLYGLDFHAFNILHSHGENFIIDTEKFIKTSQPRNDLLIRTLSKQSRTDRLDSREKKYFTEKIISTINNMPAGEQNILLRLNDYCSKNRISGRRLNDLINLKVDYFLLKHEKSRKKNYIMGLKRNLKKIFYTFKVRKKCGSIKGKVIANGKTRVTKNTHLGDNVHFNGLEIRGRGEVVIGNNFHSGDQCLLITEFHNYQGTKLPYDETSTARQILIGDNVWLGSRVTILGGVKIGEGAIIQAGSVVTCSVPPFAVAGGHPARPFKYRNKQHYETLKSERKFF